MNSIGKKLSLIIAIIGFIFLGGISLNNIRIVNTQIKNNNQLQIESKIVDYNQQIEVHKETALWITSMASEMEVVKQAYKNYNTTKDIQKSSKIIENEFANINKAIMQNLNMTVQPKIHFHLPPAVSFIRCWTDKRGDTIADFRNTVLDISKKHETISGFEIGRGGLELRALSPIFDNQDGYLGSVEVLFTLDNVIEKLDIKKDENFAIFMDSTYLKIATDFLAKDASNINLANSKLGNWIFVTSVKDSFNIETLKKHEINFSNDTSILEFDNYQYVCFPIKDYSSKIIAIGVFQKDIFEQKQLKTSVTLNNLIISVLLIIIFIISILAISHKYLSKPLKLSLNRIVQMEKGNLMPLDVNDKKDEVNTLNRYVEKMKDNLVLLIKDIKSISKNIISNSNEFKTITETVSSGASQLAATSEELAATIQEMTAIVLQNKENANESERIVTSNKNIIEQGVKTMQMTLETFDNILNKVQVINEISKKIDMLSINASIEAAKAGEQGKGFKVIAEEIRRLSDYSDKASKEISEITLSNVNLAKQTSIVLKEIVPLFQNIIYRVQEITNSSAEQNNAIEQINNSVNELVQVSQNNANSSEIMKNLNEELIEYSANLDKQLKKFITEKKDKDNRSVMMLNKIRESIEKYNSFINTDEDIVDTDEVKGVILDVRKDFGINIKKDNLDNNFESF